MRYRILQIIFVSLLLVICNHYAYAGVFGPFSGKVVDAETKKPIEGVVVLIEWRQGHLFAGSTFVDAQETLTDKEGEFYIPGVWIFNPWKRLMMKASTYFLIYKSGYGTTNDSEIKYMVGALTEDWDVRSPDIEFDSRGKPVILLKKLTVEERKKYSTPGDANVPFEKQKLLIQEINKEGRFLGLGEIGPVRR